MAFITTNALVLREVRYKESDRILTVISAEDGIMTVKASGALRKNSVISAGTQQLTYSELVLFENKDRMNVKEALVIEPFTGLRANFENYALGCYLAECVEALLPENTSEPAVMQLILNSLFALSHEMADPLLIKAAFELRLMSLLGYTPELGRCAVCGEEAPESPYLCIESGHICCDGCKSSAEGRICAITSDVLQAMRYIVSAPAKQLFSFRTAGADLRLLCTACESYLLAHSERRFPTLDYWKKIRIESI